MGVSDEDVRVRIKQSAIDANEAVADYVDRNGPVVTFDSQEAADSFAQRLSVTGGAAIAIQSAAPQDNSAVDAYLVSQPDRRTHVPDGAVDTGLTFDTTANQYGALGEALIVSHDSNPPVLAYYARQDRDIDSGDRIHVDLVEPSPVTATREEEDAALEWIPDCKAVVRDSPDGRVLGEYLCEIKTGNGSLARDQLSVMRAAAQYTSVLKIQLDITELPESYTARIRDVPVDEKDDVVVEINAGSNTRLDEFGTN